MAASVVSSGVSEIARTAVVLPPPTPPAMTIFTGTGGCRSGSPDRPVASADGFESTDNPFKDLCVAVKPDVRPAHRQIAERDQVTGEDPRHAQVHAEPGGYLGDRY